MKNLLVLSLVFASTLITLAQKRPIDLFENIDYGADIHKRNPSAYDTDPALTSFNMNLLNTEVIGIDRFTDDSTVYDNSTTEEFASLHLKVVGLTTQSPVNADVTIFYNSDFIMDRSGKTESGEFNTNLKNFGWYIISLTAPRYFEADDTVWVISEKRMIINKGFYMVPVEVGMSVTVSSINFNFGKTSLSEQSFVELDKELIFFNKNPNVVFEIAGYTDSDGPKDYNQILSQMRAQTVVDYLVSHGAERAQLVAHGYGDSRPAKSNETESGKANNRRVEFTVLSMNFSSPAQESLFSNVGQATIKN